jgi:integral membrane protein
VKEVPVRESTLVPVVTAYRVMAYVTGVVLMVLVFVGIPLQIWAHNLVLVKYVGTAHGILYIIYIVVAFAMTRVVRIPIASVQTIVVLLAGTVPVATFFVERWVSHRYIDPALAAAGAGTREHPVLR